VLEAVDEFKRGRMRRGVLTNVLEAKRDLAAGDRQSAMDALLEASHWLERETPEWEFLIEMIRRVDAGEMEADEAELERQWARLKPYGTDSPQSIRDQVRIDKPEHASQIIQAIESGIMEAVEGELETAPAAGLDEEEAEPQPEAEGAVERASHVPLSPGERREREEALESIRHEKHAEPAAEAPAARGGNRKWHLVDFIVMFVTVAALAFAAWFATRGMKEQAPPAPKEPEMPRVEEPPA
jgi:hypothetical protein